MLSLTRCVGESLTIGHDIKVKVFKTRGQQVQLGILAPDDVPIRREELAWEQETPAEDGLPLVDEP